MTIFAERLQKYEKPHAIMNREEATAMGMKFHETKHSMKRRTPWHDYSRKGTYMVTLVVAGHKCQVVGNHFLLDIPDKAAVIVHRRYTDEENARLREEWLPKILQALRREF